MRYKTSFRLKAIISLFAVMIVILMTRFGFPPACAGRAETLLDNGKFEGGWTQDTLYWTPDGGPYNDELNEIAPPEGWTAWWREGFPCVGTPGWETGRPEVRVISMIPDPARVYGGEQAVQWFTFWRCHDGGLLQQVAVKEGHYYSLRAFGHAWYSNCSHRPHDPPYDYDCQTPITWAHDWLSVGIDPTGGIDPMGPAVVWGEAWEVYGVYGEALTTGRMQAQGDVPTVFVRSEATHPLKHAESYWDDVSLLDVTNRAFLPFVRR